MRLRFLVSGLACFGLLVVLAVLPVIAQGGSTPSPSAPCTIKGTNAANLLIGTAGADVICGYGGNDTITAKGGNDVVRAGDGADTIYGDTGRDWLYGGPGNDRLYARDSQQDHVNGGVGSDYARVDNPLDVLSSVESH
jgi:Ca2+-binding RTX toxin-like protein